MQTWTCDCLFDAQALLGECPNWLPEQKRLLWVDIEGRRINLLDPRTRSNRYWVLPSHVGAAVPTTRGDFLAATRDGFVRLDPESGRLTALIDPESDRPGNRFNDGKCDPQGRFWAGTIADDRTPEACALYRLDPDLAVTKVVENVSTSNGLVWAEDQRTMYFIDTATLRVDAFDFDRHTGAIDQRRTVVEIPESMGKPDGMTIDREGMLWIALYRGGAVTRWNPQDGRCIGKVDVPARRVTSCCFGGPDHQQLFITTASIGLSEEERKQQPLAGGIFVAEPGVAGFAHHPFACSG